MVSDHSHFATTAISVADISTTRHGRSLSTHGILAQLSKRHDTKHCPSAVPTYYDVGLALIRHRGTYSRADNDWIKSEPNKCMTGLNPNPTMYLVLQIAVLANTRRWIDVCLTLVQRRRRWTNVKPTSIQRLVSAGNSRKHKILNHVDLMLVHRLWRWPYIKPRQNVSFL